MTAVGDEAVSHLRKGPWTLEGPWEDHDVVLLPVAPVVKKTLVSHDGQKDNPDINCVVD